MKYNVTLNGKIYEVDVTETDAVVTGISQVPVVAVAPAAAPVAAPVVAPVEVAAAPAEDGAAAGPSVVSVILSSFGESKTAVIKVVKEITGLGLVEAKGVVDKCPSPIKENIGVEEAEEIKKKLVEAGATVEIK